MFCKEVFAILLSPCPTSIDDEGSTPKVFHSLLKRYKQENLFTILAIFARTQGLMGKKQCHVVSQGANK